jgi:hypothetical protein
LQDHFGKDAEIVRNYALFATLTNYGMQKRTIFAAFLNTSIRHASA